MKRRGCKGIAVPGKHFCTECFALLQQIDDETQQKMEAAGLTEKDLEYNPLDLSEFDYLDID
jgi:hypothetical protein